MRNYRLYNLLLFLLLSPCVIFAQELDRKQLEKTIQQSIKKAYAASVRIWGIDSVTQRQNSAQFSGVVVDADGYILTAAHAILPSKKYKVIFPDGKEYTAVGLGRIAYEPKTGRPDVGMIKIVEKGTWPIAEMGWSASLKKNEPCISIAYPTTLGQTFPTIRIGRISNPLTVWGFVESTCKMEPGDSGGPLFDYLGRVVALHSRIEISEHVNFEIPVDLYRKYWTALKLEKNYPSLPEITDQIGTDPLANSLLAFDGLADLKGQFIDFEKGYKDYTVLIRSKRKGKPKQLLGTLFNLNLKVNGGKSRSFVLSKSSEVGDSVTVEVGARKVSAVVVLRKPENDLVLLQLKDELKIGLKLADLKDTTSAKQGDVGKFLVSVMPAGQPEISALSSTSFNIQRKFSSGYFGASANFIEEKIILTRINPGSPAELTGLKLKDQITGINGVEIKLPPEYGAELMKHSPEDVISIQGVREGVPYSLPVSLTALPSQGPHPAYHFFGGRSFRSDGFTGVFAHDAVLTPAECGGPIFDLTGKFCGINLARFSRTSCLALRPKEIYELITTALQTPNKVNLGK